MSKINFKCHVCEGEMEPYRGPRHSRKVGGFVFGAGAFTTLFFIGPIIGLPLLIIGSYMIGAKRELWVCKQCHAAIEKIILRSKSLDQEKTLVSKLSKMGNLTKKVENNESSKEAPNTTLPSKAPATAAIIKKIDSKLPQTENIKKKKEAKPAEPALPVGHYSAAKKKVASDLPKTTNVVNRVSDLSNVS